jgi:hypothetical protein
LLIINIGWVGGSNVDNTIGSVRTDSKTISITSNTVFTSTTGLTIYPLLTCYKMTPDIVPLVNLPNAFTTN